MQKKEEKSADCRVNNIQIKGFDFAEDGRLGKFPLVRKKEKKSWWPAYCL